MIHIKTHRIQLCTILVCGILFQSTACKNPAGNAPSNYNIPHLEKISYEPSSHYKELSIYDTESIQGKNEMDQIRFPNKTHKFLLKLMQHEYLQLDQITSLIHELSPPANSSVQTEKELAFLLQIQNNRTAEQIEQALRMHEIVFFLSLV